MMLRHDLVEIRRKFDPNGDYVRKWVPELAGLPNKDLHQPWEASVETLRAQGITLGTTYPKPIVEHSIARKRALDAFRSVVKREAE